MSKMLCKARRKDGSPCKGHALDQYGGYCIAHGPTPEQVHEWRARGGKNSATAVRIEKKMPEHYTVILDLLVEGMKMVMDGTLSPARYDAMCRGAKATLDACSRIEEEMKRVRTAEIKEAAAQHLEVNPDLDVLKAVDLKKAEQDRYRRESLVHQGYAKFISSEEADEPPDVVLNERGRRCFGLQDFQATHGWLEEVEDELAEFDADSTSIPNLAEMTAQMQGWKESVEKRLSGLPHVGKTPFDPLTGQAVTKLPAGVFPSRYHGYVNDYDEDPRDILSEQLNRIEEVKGMIKWTSESALYKRRVEEQEDRNRGYRRVRPQDKA